MLRDQRMKIYTDGSCLDQINNKYGGWCFCICTKERHTIIFGGEEDATNNRMELIAVIEALKWIFPNSGEAIDINTDSKYVINCAEGRWKIKKNNDLWNKYFSLAENMKIKYTWVRGHSGNKFNEFVDQVARNEAKSIKVLGHK